MKAYLIEFQYDHYCQGWDRGVWGTALVYALSYKDACDVIKNDDDFEKARNFKNRTYFQ